MAFWNKDKKSTDAPRHADIGRNDPCHCGSGKKYKKCCIDKDASAERKVLDENWAKAAAAKEQEEKKANEAAKENPAAHQKHNTNQPTSQPKHQKFVPAQTSLPRKSGGG